MAGISQGRSVSTIAGEGYSWDSVSLDAPGVSLGGDFSPQDLFFYGEQGAWYDPSDLTTMFQDRAGTTPVTSDGQTVGLILDKSKGLALGSELVINGDFSSGADGWSSSGGNTTTFTGGVCHVVGSANAGPYTEVATTPGRSYRITLDAAVVSGAYCVYVYEGGGFVTEVAVLGQCISGQFVATTAISRIYIPCFSTPDVTFDNISVRELPGNHAVAPSDAARPLYKTDGTYHWLQFDGVDDQIVTANFGIKTLNGDCFVGMNPTTGNISVWLSGQSAAGYWAVMQVGSGSSPTGGVGTPTYRVDGVELTSPTRATLLAEVVNQNSVLTTKNLIFGNETDTGISISGYSGFQFPGKIYSVIVRGALSTTDEITATETWVAAKTGVTL